MIRRSTALLALLLGSVSLPGLLATSATVGGGGGCYGPVSDGRGVSVALQGSCFLPTILRIRPGQTVTWVNRDGYPHTVTGTNLAWGDFTELAGGETFTARFRGPGVYPYICAYHPGMAGAVVVGSASGPGAAERVGVVVGPVTPKPLPTLARTAAPLSAGTPLAQAAATDLRTDETSLPWGLVILLGAVSTLLAAALLGRLVGQQGRPR